MKFCQHCGAQNTPDAVFCCGCGARMDAPSPSASYAHPGYSQPAYASTGAVRRPIQTDRSLFMYILLTLVTCGIYGWVFIYKLAQDTNDMCFEDGEKTPGLGMYILLSIVTCGFYSYYWLYKIQNRFQAAGMRYGVPVVENGTTVLMWYLFGALLCGIGPFIAMNIIITTANKIATAYNMRYCYNR